MKEGKYTIDSIESGLVKLLYREDETIEVILKEEDFDYPISEGLIVEISREDGKLVSIPLLEETEDRRAYARKLMERLKNK
ncbi:DUF3006 family protein [Planococcus sp. CAU13]|uniref:DUF3006 family protein n=1 Tax=Planococcus sp. CAU13 TaxID=1541197 RepID=UPI00052FE677|nr:DUF3006 family protein [Planococcus sp. CAU13]